MAYVILNLVCVAALVGIDQAIKLWATQYLAPVEAITVIPHVVELRFVLNQGMAFSLLSGKQLFLILATSAALLLVAYLLFFRSRGKLLQQVAFILVLAGALITSMLLNAKMADTAYRMKEKQIELNVAEDHVETLRTQVQEASAPDALAGRAKELGMVPAAAPGVVDVNKGQLTEGTPAHAAKSGK